MARKGSEGEAVAMILDVMEVTGVLKGQSFCITGHLGLPRDQVITLIERAGGVFHASPKWNTKYLVTNRDWSASSTIASGTSRKLEAARKNGTKIISEQKLFEMITELAEAQKQ